MLALFSDFIGSGALNLLVGGPTDTLVSTIQAWVGPILLLIIGVIAIGFLINRQIMQFVIFLVIAVLVAFIFYFPGVIKSIATAFNSETGF